MKKSFTLFCCLCVASAYAQPNHLVISQVYAAGGNDNALYKNDFVELFNPTATSISLTGYSLQYAGATATTWSKSNKADLAGSVAPGKYFLIQLDGGTVGRALPQPDFAVTLVNLGLSSAGGKIALVGNTTLLIGACPAGSPVVDFVGYKGSSTPNCAETAPMVTPTNFVNSISRKSNGCTDTENNSIDFEITVPSPRNSASNGHTCNGTSISITTITTVPFCVDATTGASGSVSYNAVGTFTNSTFKAMLSDTSGSFGFATPVGSALVSGTNPTGTINIAIPAASSSATRYRIRIEASNPPLTGNQSDTFEIINGAKNIAQSSFKPAANNQTITLNWTNPPGCFDEILIVAKEGSSIAGTPTGDGSAYTANLNFTGSGTAFDNGKVVYKGSAPGQTVTGLTNGVTYFFKAFVRRGANWSSGTESSESPRIVPLPGEMVFNQISPDYLGTLDEYIELVNLTGSPFNLSDVSIEIKNASGANVVAGGRLSGIIPPHGYFLILPKSTPAITVGKTVALSADLRIDMGFANTNNQLGLVRITDGLLLDGLAYGSIGTKVYAEGTPAPNPPTDGGLKRKTNGADANNNQADFATVANADIELRNSSSRLANANATIAGGTYTTLEVTGNATLQDSVSVQEKTILTNGYLSLGNFTLTTKNIMGGRAASYIKTNGAGVVAATNLNGEILLPVGNSTYNPVTVRHSEGLTWRVSVIDSVTPRPTPFGVSAAVKRTWNVAPVGTLSTGATVVFEYNDADAAQIGSTFTPTDPVRIWNYHERRWLAATDIQTPVLVQDRKAVTLTNYNRFSPFVISNNVNALPVRFVDVSARLQGSGVLVRFTNATETDVVLYTVERSGNGRDFEARATIAPTSNAGAASYQWLDETPLPGTNWYRVRSLETNGTITYTTVLQVTSARDIKKLLVFPNPVQRSRLTWQATLPQGSYGITVYAASGQSVYTRTFYHTGGHYTETITLLQTVAPGLYRLQVRSGPFVQTATFRVL